VVAEDGTGFLDDVAPNLPVLERAGPHGQRHARPQWLAFCRHSIAQLTGWQAGSSCHPAPA